MKCAYYNPDTLEVVCYGTISEDAFDVASSEGRPVIPVDEFPADFAIHLYDVDPVTKALVKAANPRPDPAAPLPELPERNRLRPISDRQFFMKAALDGYITQGDALKAVQTGFIPARIQATIDQIQDPTIKFTAEMLFSGGTTFYRPDPLVEAVLMDFGLDDVDAMNEFFRVAAAL